MNKVTVHEAKQEQITFNGRKDQQVTKYRQVAFVWIEGSPYPKEFNIDTWPDRKTGVVKPPLPAGEYVMVPKVVAVGRYGDPIFENTYKPAAAKS